ncbi:hypothetical protein [Neolewinella persica]|uniref:hypothetical protein n=1 Tax=Neolewinella persica TaxID=70998 RepID=UPI0003604D0A|nr:hypothetical protein [Neolewinella persica]
MKIATYILSFVLIVLINSCGEIHDAGIITYNNNQVTTSYVVFDKESSKWFQPKQQQGGEELNSKYFFKKQKDDFAIRIFDTPNFKAFNIISPWEGYVKVQSNQRKDILGFDCRATEIISRNNRKLFLVWHTDRIQPGVGPEKWWGFNGAVLEVVDLLNEETLFKATAIDIDFQEDVLSPPDTTNMINLEKIQDMKNG